MAIENWLDDWMLGGWDEDEDEDEDDDDDDDDDDGDGDDGDDDFCSEIDRVFYMDLCGFFCIKTHRTIID